MTQATAQPDKRTTGAPTRQRRRWPWVVGALLLLVAVVVAFLALVPRGPAGPAYLTTAAASRTVSLTAQGTGTIADARVDSIGSDNTWTVTERDGLSTGASVQGSAVDVSVVDVAVGQSVVAGQRLALVIDAADEELAIVAPEDGIIRSVSATAASSGAGVLFTLGVGGLRVVAPISEYDIADVAVGQVVDFVFDALGTTGTGAVVSIGSGAESQAEGAASSVTEYSVVSTVVEPPEALRLGMSVQMSVAVQSVEDALAVPVQALTEDAEGGYTVLTLDAGGVAVAVPVEVGLIGDSFAEITSGLAAGDEVVIGTPGVGTTPVFGPPATGDGN